MEEDRQQQMRAKGFNMFGLNPQVEYGTIKVGPKTLDDAVINLGAVVKINRTYGNKLEVLKAIYERDLYKMREISRFFYNSNGIYTRTCDYFAYLYRYDWYIVPRSIAASVKNEKVLTDFNQMLLFFDDSNIQKLCGKIAKNVIIDGVYYGYRVKSKDKIMLQDLPVNYCRTRYDVGDSPVVEFNMRFFDDHFRRVEERMKILKMFPQEFQKGYLLYKQNKLTEDYVGEDWAERNSNPPRQDIRRNPYYKNGWFPLEPSMTVRFCLNDNEQPPFVSSIPAILDLDAAQDLDRRKQLQQLQKIVIQQLPLDKNGDLIFDVDEARDIHNNAVQMLQHSIGTDVLTTFADISVEDIADTNASESNDTLERMERAVYNSLGLSRNLFNTDGNLSLEKSILDDASAVRPMLLQFQSWLNSIARELSTNKKKYVFDFYMLETTDYNYIDLAKLYKEQVQNGYSRMLTQVALGHSQSSIINTAYFENEVLNLDEIMIPPLSSNTMNSNAILDKTSKSNTSKNQNQTEGTSTAKTTANSSGTAGRPEKSDSEKSEKTIANKESMS